MNTTFNSALKQRTTIRKDLSALSGGGASPNDAQHAKPQLTPAALGSLSASLTAFARTIDEYSALAKQELNPAKQEKAFERIRDFRAELSDFRAQFDALKAARDDAAHAENRRELLGRRPYATATPENPYAGTATSTATATASGYGLAAGAAGRGHARTTSVAEAGGGGGLGMGSGDVTRESHALREQQFFANTHSALDEYIARGQAVLGDLSQQREMLKSTQRKLYSVGNTLGISGDTIRMIERRAKEDKWIFGVGVVVFFLFCWLVLHYLR
ncbi:V-snare-domain-containing protein [Thermothelomyces heterothallicus CBS 203.75]